MKKRMLLSAALLLSACSGTPQAPDASTGKAIFQALSLPDEVAQVTLEVRGTEAATQGEVHTLTATVKNGAATFTVPNLVKGAYTLVARGYDGADAEKVVLYKGSSAVQFKDEAPIALRMNRLTSAIQVTATGVMAKSNVLVAKVGALEARLIGSGSTATGTLQGVPTGRAISVVVEGRSTDGALQQQGTATLRLSEQDAVVSVPLTEVVTAVAPAAPTLTADATVKKNALYTLNIGAQQTGSAQLQTVTVDWGDGATETLTVSGQSAGLNPTHTYTAPGTRNVSVTVRNTAGLSSTGGVTVNVLDTTTGNVTVDIGANVAPVTLGVTGVEADRVTATITAPDASLGAASLRPQDLKKTYTLELVPRGQGNWSGTLSLPVGYTYTVQPRAITGEQVRDGEVQTFTAAAEGTAVSLPFGAGGETAPTCPAPTGTVTNIGAVQGSGAASPLAGQTVTVRGVVTSDFQAGLGGFSIQEVAPDGNDATSDGLFVFTGGTRQTVAVGDVVQVSGTVKEYFGATQLESVTTFQKCSGTQVAKPVTLTFPVNSLDQLEQYENMLVTIPQVMTVTDNYGYGRYGELGLSSGGRLFIPTNGNVSGETAATQALRRIVLNDASNAQNPATLPYLSGANTRRTGDTVSGLTGLLRYANNVFKLEPTAAPQFVEANPRQAAPKPVGGSLRVAGANVLNYFTSFTSADRGANSAYEFERQKAKVVSTLLGLDADVITLMEIQNNGDVALEDLVAALNAKAGAGTYAAVKTGKVGTDAITVAVIYKPGKVTPVGSFLTDTNSINDRPPVAQTFRENGTGEVFSVVANHFKSKGCGTGNTTDTDQGQGCWNLKRVEQARQLLNFVKTVQTTSGDPDVLLMGDLNSYGEEDPIRTLTAGGFESLNKRIPAEDRYSYQFGGQFGYLDHALSSTALSGQVTGITEWHVNSDEPTFLDYNVEFKNNPNCTSVSNGQPACTTPDLFQPDAFRSSDHDPVLVGLNLKSDTPPATTPSVSLTPGTASLTVTAGAPAVTRTFTTSAQNVSGDLKLSVTALNNAPELVTVPATVASGQGFEVKVTTSSTTAPGEYVYEVKAASGTVSSTATLTVTVQAPVQASPALGKLVISQVYGGGGNSGAPLRSDYVELFNRSAVPVSTAGLSLQYAGNTATFSASNTFALPTATIAPGAYYLVKLADGSNASAPALPTPDATGSLALGGTGGKIALVGNAEAITGASDSDVIDFVGFGTGAGEREGTANTPAPSNTTSIFRKLNGCQDTNQNGDDFVTGAPAPRNSATPLNVCN
ncbi:ExeM/NucH family extracellular endonuclease [Deinococcus sp. NW-56]|uniref:ExeM/NucH family extracellular endonuclease n=1 Tax=Deinococcus sp. NW-56 TaxID=2080419 RepID=UPI001F3B0658|nr:ExeM/NucH family extracellular endonuclease [Deinococcus sp. NW-56]